MFFLGPCNDFLKKIRSVVTILCEMHPIFSKAVRYYYLQLKIQVRSCFGKLCVPGIRELVMHEPSFAEIKLFCPL